MGPNPFVPSEPNPVVGPYVDGLTPWERSLPIIIDNHRMLLTECGQSRLSGVAPLRPGAFRAVGAVGGQGPNYRQSPVGSHRF
jgi:hypothetical protein